VLSFYLRKFEFSGEIKDPLQKAVIVSANFRVVSSSRVQCDDKMTVGSLLKNWQNSLGRTQKIPLVENLVSGLYRTLAITFIPLTMF